jgi:hypothetical protein
MAARQYRQAGRREPRLSIAREVPRFLRVAYSTCVTAEMALEGQNADRDRDILCALHTSVSEPLGREAEKLDALIAELCGSRPAT